MSSDQLVKDILSEDKKRRSRAFRELYQKCFPLVRQYVLKNSGTVDEAMDLFQETITTAYYNLLNNKFRGDASLPKYVNSIARNLWLMKLRKKALDTVPLENQQIEEKDDIADHSLLYHLLDKLGEGCRRIIKRYYFDEERMEDIATALGLGSAQAAKNKKYRCMQKLNELVQAHELKNHHFRQ